MKYVFAIILLLLPVWGWGQSEEANMLYKEGKKLIKAGKVGEAVTLFLKVDSLDKTQLQPTSNNYFRAKIEIAICLAVLSSSKQKEGKIDEANKLNSLSLTISKMANSRDNSVDSLLLDIPVNVYSECAFFRNYEKEIKIQNKISYLQEKANDANAKSIDLLDALADSSDKYGIYTKALKYNIEAMESRKKTFGEEHPDYIKSLNHVANDYNKLGNYSEALKHGTKAMEISKNIFGEESLEYAKSLNYLAIYNESIGNYYEALKLGTQAMEIDEKIVGEEHTSYACDLNNVANYYADLGNYSEAIKHGTKAMEIRKRILGDNSQEYAQSLRDLATYYTNQCNYQEAIKYGTQAMEIQEKIFNHSNHPELAYTLNKLAYNHFQIGNFRTAHDLCVDALIIRRKMFGENHPDYIESLNTFTYLGFLFGEHKGITKYYQESYDLMEALVLKNFSYLTDKERSYYWNMYSAFFNNQLPFVAYFEPNSTLKNLTLNGQLLSKGLLLNAELEIQNLIEKQGNEELKEKYNKLKQDHKILDELYQLPINKRSMNADSLSKVIDKEERFLVESCQEIGDYTKSLSIKWTDIQQHLQDNDVAIEFANFTDTSKKEIYIALIVKKGMTSPELVKLDYSETDTVDYTTHSLYNKIWQPLEKYLQGVQNVYFSPTGKFHTIGIEYLPDDNGEIFAKKYSAYRLSSTREIALQHVANLNKKASVYGGIVYNFDESDWQNVSDDAERAGVTFLKGAKKESEEITQILSEGSFNVQFGTDKAATEESFKNLSGSGIKILHIATHGFYEPEDKEKSFADMLSVGDKNSKEDFSLSRSGLFLAGANTALDPEQRKYIPDGVDDGILTAKEISRMDFKGLDLVVLSACQTGLGEVTGEGVFGLQRGFKKAGAQTIVMSLWNVNDKPTKELMTEFYRNLVAGKTKREAFISAQDKIRLKYIDPKMWAGFIMVDGME